MLEALYVLASNPRIMRILTALLLFFSSQAFSLCDQSYERMKDWYMKENKIESDFIVDLGKEADSILVVRVVSVDNSESELIRQHAKMKVLKSIKGKYKEGQIISKDSHEDGAYEVTVCGDPDPREIKRVRSLAPKFKYLVYLRGNKILRVNQFEEWIEYISPEMELDILKR